MQKKTGLSLYLILMLGPLLLGVGYSLLYSLGIIGLLNEGFTLEHWQRLFRSSDAWRSMGYSIWLTVLSLALSLLLALLTSWWFVRRFDTGRLYGWLFLPLLFPPLIAGFAWFYLLSPGGILARIAYHLGLIEGIEAFPRLVNDTYSIAILLTHIFLVFPVFSLLFIEQSKKLRMPELLQSALTLGSKYGQFFRQVHVPLLLSRSRPVIWLYGIFLLGTYEVPLLLGRSTPRVVTIFITEKLTKYQLEDISMGHAMAVVYTLFVLLVISFFINRKVIRLF